jgi:hypothetical protein
VLLSTKHLLKYEIRALDGAPGSALDFYFDDVTWTIRYLVVKTGTWLAERPVLISPAAVGQPDESTKSIPVALTSEQIRNAPDISADLPVSRQREQELVRHYGWISYWDAITPLAMATVIMPPEPAEKDDESSKTPVDPHLRSATEVLGYHIEAADGSIGHAEDLLAETSDWVIRYMVVDTRNWLPGRKVLISPAWIRRVVWSDRSVLVDLRRQQIEQSPPFDPAAPVNRDYESRLYDYYGRRVYWK